MEKIYEVFEGMKRQGPGSAQSTLRAFQAIPRHHEIMNLLDIGCGKGAASLALATACQAQIAAVDNHQPFLDDLLKEAARQGLEGRIEVGCLSMFSLPFPDGFFDLLWSEGSAYFMGFERALREWKRLLRHEGFLFVSDAVMTVDTPSPECAEFWQKEYPDVGTPESRTRLAQELGYKVLDAFLLPKEDWAAYYDDMERQVRAAIFRHGSAPLYDNLKKEIHIGRTYADEFSYICLTLQKT